MNSQRAFLCGMDLDFKKMGGLVTAVIQDHLSGRVLMVGFMNEEAFSQDRRNRLCHLLQPLPQQAVAEG